MSEIQSPEELVRSVLGCECDPEEVALPCWEGEDDEGRWCWHCTAANAIAALIRADRAATLMEAVRVVLQDTNIYSAASELERMAQRVREGGE